MRWHKTYVEWGPNESWWFYWWNYLKPSHRYVGYEFMWHDGPHATFGFWFFNISWRTAYMYIPKEWR